MFEPNASWSLPAHLFLVSEWSANCTNADDPFELHERSAEPRLRRSDAKSNRGRSADLRVDRPDVPAAQARCPGATTSSAAPSPTARTTTLIVRAGQAEREDARHLEPAAVLRHRHSRQPARQHPVVSRILQGGEEREAAGGVWVVPSGRGQRAPAGTGNRGPDVRDQPRQRGDARARLELDRDLPRLGRLGRLLRPRRAAESTRTATACASPAS